MKIMMCCILSGIMQLGSKLPKLEID